MRGAREGVWKPGRRFRYLLCPPANLKLRARKLTSAAEPVAPANSGRRRRRNPCSNLSRIPTSGQVSGRKRRRRLVPRLCRDHHEAALHSAPRLLTRTGTDFATTPTAGNGNADSAWWAKQHIVHCKKTKSICNSPGRRKCEGKQPIQSYPCTQEQRDKIEKLAKLYYYSKAR